MNPKKQNIDYLYELIMTFSNRRSLFSSKKIERFIVFWVFLITTIIYISINIRTIESWDFVEISALWLAYGGYNSLMSLRDKKADREISGIEIDQPEATSGEEGEEEGDIDPKATRKRP